jgi:type IV secretion system protein VirB10
MATMGGNANGMGQRWLEQFGANAGQHFNNAGQAWTQKNMNLQPTITIRPGWSLNVIVNRDMVLKPYFEPNS